MPGVILDSLIYDRLTKEANSCSKAYWLSAKDSLTESRMSVSGNI